MKTTMILHVVLYVFLMPVVLYAETKDSEKARVLVTTDLGGADPGVFILFLNSGMKAVRHLHLIVE